MVNLDRVRRGIERSQANWFASGRQDLKVVQVVCGRQPLGFHLFHVGASRTLLTLLEQQAQSLFGAFCKHLDTTIGDVAYPTTEAQSARVAFDKKAEAHALDNSANHEVQPSKTTSMLRVHASSPCSIR